MSESYYIRYEPGIESKHGRLLHGVCTRKDLSLDRLASKRVEWDDLDERVIAYMPEQDMDRILKAEFHQAGDPQYYTIRIPWSYAVLSSAHTYLTTVFLGRDPVFQYTARHGASQQNVLSVEALMAYQYMVGEMQVPMYLWFYDAYKYGLGVTCSYWDEVVESVATIEMRQPTLMGIPMGEPKKVKVTKEVKGYAGNRVFNVRPHDFLPDPRVPIGEYQRGEFCGRVMEVGWNTMVRGQETGKYFNVDVLKMMARAKAAQREQGSSQRELPETGEAPDSRTFAGPDEFEFVELTEMVWELVPNDWGLGSGKSPEKWVFTVANDEVIVRAQPLGEWHNRYPYHVMEPEFTGYQLASRSPLETIGPFEDVLTWMFNSHMYNVRKVLNDQMVYDPSRVEEEDLFDPLPGGLIRLKPAAYGTNAKDAVFQLQVHDVTQQHLQTANVIVEMMQRMTGVSDQIMGMMNQGGRKTATEVRTASNFGVTRLKTIAEYLSAQAFTPMSQMMLQRTQQFYDMEETFRVVGDQAQGLEQYVQVTPEAVAGFYDFVPVDGTMPVDRFAQASLWKDLIQNAAQIPQVVQQYDLGRVFAHVARLTGIKNMDQFRVQVMPDQALMQQAQQGGVVPIGGQGGGSPAGSQQKPRNASEVRNSASVGGMGLAG